MNLIEVFCRKKHLYLVFEFVDRTVLDDLDQCAAGGGLDEDTVRRVLWQVLKGIHFCHVHNVRYTIGDCQLLCFYPRDAILARILAMALSVSVCVCVRVCHKSV